VVESDDCSIEWTSDAAVAKESALSRVIPPDVQQMRTSMRSCAARHRGDRAEQHGGAGAAARPHERERRIASDGIEASGMTPSDADTLEDATVGDQHSLAHQRLQHTTTEHRLQAE
jgi:hypothetical protein